MNWDQIEGKWQELKGEFRQKWAKLTDQDYEQIGGKKDELVGRLQKHYGYSKEDAERELDTFSKDLKH